MFPTYKKRRVLSTSRTSYQQNWVGVDQQSSSQSNRPYLDTNRSLVVRHFNKHQSQEQTTPCPLPDGPLFERSLLNPIWKDRRTIGPGIVNSQNNCFLNSVLQCLTYTPSLAQYFLEYGHRSSCALKGFCAMCAMDHHVHRCLLEEPKSWIEGAAILPRAFTANIHAISQTLHLGRQEDAHEFMMCLLNSLHKSTIQVYGNLDAKVERTAFIYQIFGGQLRSQLRCRSCNATSDTFDNFLNLSIDLQDAKSLHEALENFIKVDQIGDDDFDSKYQCGSCKQKVDAEKQITIHELPSYLCVHLKRFTFDLDSGYMQKLTEDIQYKEDLDMAPFVSKEVNCRSTIYYLYALVVHVEYHCHRGHYLAYVKAPDGNWFRMDDHDVTNVSLEKVLSQQAYMLFYTTENNPTLSMAIKNKACKVDVLPDSTVDNTNLVTQEKEPTDLDPLLAFGTATTAAVAEKTNPFAKTTAKEVDLPWRGIGTINDETADERRPLENLLGDHNKQQPSTALKENQYKQHQVHYLSDENLGYFTDGFSTWSISSWSQPIRSLRGNLSPPTFTAAVTDVSIWKIEDQDTLYSRRLSLSNVLIDHDDSDSDDSDSDDSDSDDSDSDDSDKGDALVI